MAENISDLRVLVTGAGGQLAEAFTSLLAEVNNHSIALGIDKLDITDPEQVQGIVAQNRPDVLINAAAFTDVERAESNFALANEVNQIGVLNLKNACQANQTFLVHFSSDYVFDGKKRSAYVESDEPNPLNAYGKSKLLGDQVLLNSDFNHFLIFRCSWIFGHGQQNFLSKLLKWSESNNVLEVVYDQISTPTYTFDIAEIALKCIVRQLRGLYNLTNTGYASRYEVARELFRQLQIDKLVLPVPSSKFPTPVRRPFFSQLSNQKLSKAVDVRIPHWQDALKRYLAKEGLLK